MAYTTTAQIRRITNIVSADILDAELNDLIGDATAQLNSDINIRVVRERVEKIDNTRDNAINGINTIFYIKNWEMGYIADMNDDGEVDEDDIKVYLVDSSGTETEATVSSVDIENGKFVLSTAPNSSLKMFITYEYCIEIPTSKRISLACAFLTAAYAYEKINRGMSPQQVYGNTRFMRDMRAGNSYFQRYESEISKINGEMGDYSESEVF